MKKKESTPSSSVRKGMFGRTISKSTDSLGTKNRTVSRTKRDGSEVVKSKTTSNYGGKKLTTKSKTTSTNVPGSAGNKNPFGAKRLVESKIKQTSSGQGLKNRNVYSSNSTSVETGYGKGTNTELLSKKQTEKTGLFKKRVS